jgi:heme-degrading monooxygenase HmoA
MYARVSTYDIPAERMDEAIAAFDADDRVPVMPGILEAYLLVDRPAGTALTITLWEDEAAMRATEEGAHQVRTEASGSARGTVRGVDRYEVALHERFVPEGAPAVPA